MSTDTPTPEMPELSTSGGKTFPVQPDELGLTYLDEGSMRQAAAFVFRDGSWLYHSRGTAQEARSALVGKRPGFIGGLGEFAPEEVRLILDQPSFGTTDGPDLCWSGPTMSVPDFIDWYEERIR